MGLSVVRQIAIPKAGGSTVKAVVVEWSALTRCENLGLQNPTLPDLSRTLIRK